MNERLREFRLSKGLSQEEMGKLLGISKSGVSDIEAGRRKVTEQHIIMLKNSKSFNINEEWLRTGNGSMELELTKEEEIAEFTANLFLDQTDSFRKRLIAALAKLSPEQWDLLEDIIDNVSNMKKE